MYAIVDIETTGGGIRWSRITEIAIFVHDGQQVTDSFSSLVNPGMPIPPFISQLTGITDAMVQEAPTFEEIAPVVEQLTRDCIFVAHNVHFDYNFIRSEFSRLGLPFERNRLCTVRLGRQYLPGKASYSLGKLCEELGISIHARHRAAGDAEATVKVLERVLAQAGVAAINATVAFGSPYEQLNKRLRTTRLEDVPQTSGVLHLLDAAGNTLYIEGTTNLRRRAIAFLKNKGGRTGSALQASLDDIHVEETGSSLLALLLANEAILKIKPPFNKAVGTAAARWKIEAVEGADSFLYLKVVKGEPGEPAPYSSKKQASEKLSHLLKQFFLCRRFSSLKKADCAPAACLKACSGNEETLSYNKRALAAITATAQQGKGQLIIDKGRHGHERVVIVENEQQNVRWGLLEGGSSGYTQEEIIASATRILKSAKASSVLRRYLQKNHVYKIFSYGSELLTEGL